MKIRNLNEKMRDLSDLRINRRVISNFLSNGRPRENQLDVIL